VSLLAYRTIGPAGPAVVPIDALDRGFQLGDGVFDTMAAAGGLPLLIDRHLDRLDAYAHDIGIVLDRGAALAAIEAVLSEAGRADMIVRTTVTRGQSARGLWPAEPPRPTILVTAQSWDRAIIGQPARLVMASTPRNERSILSRLKSLAYLDNILAAREAAEAGADDALILNTRGRVAGSTIANLFVLIGNRLLTPPMGEGCLGGIMRAVLLEEAGSLGLEAAEASLAVEDVRSADAVFLTNSLRLLRPVTAVGDAAIPVPPIAHAVLSHLTRRMLPS
jgi:branched-chain amino acid aminotransferase